MFVSIESSIWLFHSLFMPLSVLDLHCKSFTFYLSTFIALCFLLLAILIISYILSLIANLFVFIDESFGLFHSLLLFLCLSLCLIYTVYLSLFISLHPIALCFLPLACTGYCMHSRLFMFIYFCIYWWQYLLFQCLHFLSLCLVYIAYLSFSSLTYLYNFVIII
jgi:hypothetical protein